MSAVKRVVCPHCSATVEFKKGRSGKWIGTAVGGGAGYVIAGGLGIAGAIVGAPIAIPAVAVGVVVGALLGNRAGAMVDDATVTCPKCSKSFSL